MAGLEDIAKISTLSTPEMGRLSKIFEGADLLAQEGASALQKGDVERAKFLYLRAAEVAKKSIPVNDSSARQYGDLLVEWYRDVFSEIPREAHYLND